MYQSFGIILQLKAVVCELLLTETVGHGVAGWQLPVPGDTSTY